MADRKTPRHIPQEKFKPPSIKKRRDLNSTVCNTAELNLTRLASGPINSTDKLNITTASMAISNPAADLEVRCDLAYGEYLQALFMKKKIEATIKENKIILNDQISALRETMFVKLKENRELEQEISDMKKQIELQTSLVKLEKQVQVSVDVLKDHKIDEHLDNIIKVLKCACDKLYLQNVKCLLSQEEYNEFADSLKMCVVTMNKIHNIIGDSNNFAKLTNLVKECQALQDEIRVKELSAADLESDIGCQVLKCASDMFASYREYIKD